MSEFNPATFELNGVTYEAKSSTKACRNCDFDDSLDCLIAACCWTDRPDKKNIIWVRQEPQGEAPQ